MEKIAKISCTPCGFMVQSHKQKELINMAKMHAKTEHKTSMSDAAAKRMIKMG